MTASARPTSFAEDHAGLLLSGAVIISLIIVSLLIGQFGHIGPDGDDAMRLVQVRELLDGQAWFDLRQTRLGPEGGTLMHWSRLVDLPIAAITQVFAPFVGRETALSFAITIWPLLTVLLVTSGLVTGARALGGRGVVVFACLIAFAVLYRHFRFLPGAIDHHNLQLGLLVISSGALLMRGQSAAPMMVAGAGLALAAAIGVEVHLFVAAMAAFVAADWAVRGEEARRGAVVFGACFAAMLATTFLIAVPPDDYWVARCDVHSSVTLLAGLAGGVAFALAAQLTSTRSRVIRFAALANVAAVCMVIVLLVGPQCLSNPLDALSPEVRTLWLARVDEARPTMAFLNGQLDEVLFRLGTPVCGLAAALFLILRGDQVRAQILFILLLTMSIVFALYQTRFYVFGQLFAVLPLAMLAARIHAGAAGDRMPRLAYLGVVFLSIPAMWAAAGTAIAPPKAPPAAQLAASEACDPVAVHAALNALPPGRILAPASDAPGILLNTPHASLYGHYHRNPAGIEAALAIFTISPNAARTRLASNRVDYLLVCPSDPDIRFFAAEAPKGLIGEVIAGRVPAWLEPALVAGPATIYRIRQP